MQTLQIAELPLGYEPPEESDHLIAHQRQLELLYNKNQTLTRVRQELLDFQDGYFQSYMLEKGIDADFGIELMVQMVLHKRTTLPTLVGIMRSYFGDSQQTVDEIKKCAEADLVDWNPVTEQFIIVVNISADVQAEIDKFQYPLPMVIKPRPVLDNKDTGYLTSRSSVILRKNHHDDDVCLDHINRMNKMKFAIDHDTMNMVSNTWADLDKPKQGESKEDFDKRTRAFQKYDRTAKEVMNLLLKFGNEFYLTHKYDKRGRTYCQGYHVTYQGACWNKAVIELADKEMVI